MELPICGCLLVRDWGYSCPRSMAYLCRMWGLSSCPIQLSLLVWRGPHVVSLAFTLENCRFFSLSSASNVLVYTVSEKNSENLMLIKFFWEILQRESLDWQYTFAKVNRLTWVSGIIIWIWSVPSQGRLLMPSSLPAPWELSTWAANSPLSHKYPS